MILNKKNLKKIKGDASFRIFFRKKNKLKNSIIVYAERKKKKNLLIYDSINKIFIKNKILAPKLFHENYRENYIEIEDFGNKTIFNVLNKKKINKLKLFKKIISLLVKVQKIKNYKIKNFQKKNYSIPVYSKSLLFKEASLFLNWYVPDIIPKKKIPNINKELQKIIMILLSKIRLANNTFVHRDFHISNLMPYKNKIAIIDSQDALFGNRAYDLASLIDDVRFKTSNKLKNLIFKHYLNLNKNKFNHDYFKNDFEILSVLRNLKIIGIFTRLASRDKKKKYLKLIPYTWKLIEMRLKNDSKFKDLKNCLEKNFPNKIRIKK